MVNIRKIEAILAYFANFTDPRYLGKVKLMKLFYFLDFTHAKKYGAPITYDTYFNLEHGPIPSQIKNLVDTVADDPAKAVLSTTIACEFPKGIDMCRIIPKRDFTEADKELFSRTELSVLEEVTKRYARANTAKIEEDSHSESPWKETHLLEKIPYYLAAHDKDAKVSEDEIKLSTLV